MFNERVICALMSVRSLERPQLIWRERTSSGIRLSDSQRVDDVGGRVESVLTGCCLLFTCEHVCGS